MTAAAILVAEGFQDEEYVYAYYRMLEQGWSVDVLTPQAKVVHGKYGVPARANCGLEWPWTKYDALVIPGGFESPDRLRMVPAVQKRVREHFEAGRLVAAICHGPWVCISAGIVKGRNVAGYQSIKDDLENAGAHYSHAAVITDGNLITADHYRNNGPFMQAVVRYMRDARPDWGTELCGAAAVNL